MPHTAPPRSAAARAPVPTAATVDLCLCRRDSNTQKQVCRSLLWWSPLLSLGPGAHNVLFAPFKHLWQVWGLILNTTRPSCWDFFLALGCGVSFSVRSYIFLSVVDQQLAQILVFTQEKMSTIKNRNGLDLTEAEDIKKRWQKYTEELYIRDLHDPDNHNGVITYLEPDTLECKVKWALGSIIMNKASEGDGIQVELYQILKDDAVKVLHSICQQIWKTQQCHRTGKDLLSFQTQRKAMPKDAQTTTQLHSSHTLAKKCSKFSKPGFNSTWTVNFKMFKLDLEKAEEPEIKLPTSVGSSKKQESSRKTSTSALLTMQSLWLFGSQQTVENSSSDGNTRLSDLPPEKPVCRSRSNS